MQLIANHSVNSSRNNPFPTNIRVFRQDSHPDRSASEHSVPQGYVQWQSKKQIIGKDSRRTPEGTDW